MRNIKIYLCASDKVVELHFQLQNVHWSILTKLLPRQKFRTHEVEEMKKENLKEEEE